MQSRELLTRTPLCPESVPRTLKRLRLDWGKVQSVACQLLSPDVAGRHRRGLFYLWKEYYTLSRQDGGPRYDLTWPRNYQIWATLANLLEIKAYFKLRTTMAFTQLVCSNLRKLPTIYIPKITPHTRTSQSERFLARNDKMTTPEVVADGPTIRNVENSTKSRDLSSRSRQNAAKLSAEISVDDDYQPTSSKHRDQRQEWLWETASQLIYSGASLLTA